MSTASLLERPSPACPATHAHATETPLSAVLEFLELLDRDDLLDDPDILRGYLALVRGQAGHLARLVSEAIRVTAAAKEPGPDQALPARAPLRSVAPLVSPAQPALIALSEFRALQSAAQQDRSGRLLAEAQQLRAVRDFRVAHQEAVALAERLRGAALDSMIGLAKAIEARDDYTGGHIERVRRYSLSIATTLGLPQETLLHLEFGAVLHDVGKIGVPDAVLGKPGPLSPDEWVQMQRHPEIGHNILKGIALLAPSLDAVLCHHERWDGRGYPAGLAGEGIPLLGRIVAIADAFDAMTSDRPYRQGLSSDTAIAKIVDGRGRQFDSVIVDAFLSQPPRPADLPRQAGDFGLCHGL